MTNTILLKRSAVATHVPTTLQMTIGEVAANTYDGKIFLRGNNGTDYVSAIGAHTYSGDATGTATGAIGETVALTLANSGVSAGTFTKVTVNAKGLVTVGGALSSGDVTTALSFTPVNKAGDTMSGVLTNASGFVGPVTGNVTGNASTANAWASAMTLGASGDATGSVSFTGASASTIALTLANSGVTAGTFTKVTVNAKGLVTAGAALSSLDVTTALTFTPYNSTNPAGYISGTTISGAQVDTALGYTPVAAVSASVVAALGFTPVNKAGDTMTGALTATSFSGPLTGNVTGNVSGTAAKWAAAMAFGTSGDATGSGSFDGSTGTTIALTLANSGVAAGTYDTVVVNSKGIVTSASNVNTTLTGDVTGTGLYTMAVTLATVATAGTYTKVYVNAKGLVTMGGSVVSADVTGALGYTPVNPATLGVANGIATLDGSGHVPLSQLPGVVAGAMNYTGVWNASTNSPSLTNTPLAAGAYYLVSTAGSTSITGRFGAITQWLVGDMIVSDGTYWDKIDGSQTEVSSVNGMTGAVTVSTITGNAGTASKWAAPMTFALSGDATTSGSFDGSATTTLPLTLAASGVSAGTWSKVTVNTKGLVTTGANIATGDVTTALGFTPVNKAGDTMSGALTASGFSGPLTGNVTGNVTGNASTASKWAATMTFGTSGDATGSGSFDGSTGTTIALTLANSGATAGTYSALVVNAKGLVTAGANMTVTGDVTGTSSGAGLALTLATSGVTAGTYIGFTVNAKGLVTAVTTPTTCAGYGLTDAVTTSSTIDGGSF